MENDHRHEHASEGLAARATGVAGRARKPSNIRDVASCVAAILVLMIGCGWGTASGSRIEAQRSAVCFGEHGATLQDDTLVSGLIVLGLVVALLVLYVLPALLVGPDDKLTTRSVSRRRTMSVRRCFKPLLAGLSSPVSTSPRARSN